MKTTGLSALPLAAALVLATTPALAQESGFYAGVAGGISTTRFDTAANERDVNAALAPIGITVRSSVNDETAATFRALAGYQVNRNFAVEFAYAHFGTFSQTYNITAGGSGSVVADFKGRGFNAAAVGILPVSDTFDVRAKLGANAWRLESKASASGAGGTASAGDSANGVGALLGVGAEYRFTSNFGVRAEWERMFDVGDENKTGQGDVDLFTIALNWYFR